MRSSLAAIFGVLTWYLDNFSQKDNLKRISGICGAISMIPYSILHSHLRLLMIEGDWSEFVPVRLPVDWEYKGEPGIHPKSKALQDVMLFY